MNNSLQLSLVTDFAITSWHLVFTLPDGWRSFERRKIRREQGISNTCSTRFFLSRKQRWSSARGPLQPWLIDWTGVGEKLGKKPGRRNFAIRQFTILPLFHPFLDAFQKGNEKILSIHVGLSLVILRDIWFNLSFFLAWLVNWIRFFPTFCIAKCYAFQASLMWIRSFFMPPICPSAKWKCFCTFLAYSHFILGCTSPKNEHIINQVYQFVLPQSFRAKISPQFSSPTKYRRNLSNKHRGPARVVRLCGTEDKLDWAARLGLGPLAGPGSLWHSGCIWCVACLFFFEDPGRWRKREDVRT